MKLYQTIAHILAKRDTAAQANDPAEAAAQEQAAVAVAAAFLPEGATLDADTSTPGRIVVIMGSIWLEVEAIGGGTLNYGRYDPNKHVQVVKSMLKALHHKTA